MSIELYLPWMGNIFSDFTDYLCNENNRPLAHIEWCWKWSEQFILDKVIAGPFMVRGMLVRLDCHK